MVQKSGALDENRTRDLFFTKEKIAGTPHDFESTDVSRCLTLYLSTERPLRDQPSLNNTR